jgi:VanZ like protein
VDMFLRVIKPLLPLIPIGLAAVGLIVVGLGVLRVRRGRARKEAFAGAALDTLLGASFVSVFVLTLPPSIDAGRSIELIPFSRGWHNTSAEAEMLANMILFVPLGMFAPARWSVLDEWKRVVLAALALSVGIEAAQFAFGLGRQSSITDVILNAIGATLGYLVLRMVRRRERHSGARRMGDPNPT